VQGPCGPQRDIAARPKEGRVQKSPQHKPKDSKKPEPWPATPSKTPRTSTCSTSASSAASAEDVYKVGRTEWLVKRMNQYPKGSVALATFAVGPAELKAAEAAALALCRRAFKHRTDIGAEYFERAREAVVAEVAKAAALFGPNARPEAGSEGRPPTPDRPQESTAGRQRQIRVGQRNMQVGLRKEVTETLENGSGPFDVVVPVLFRRIPPLFDNQHRIDHFVRDHRAGLERALGAERVQRILKAFEDNPLAVRAKALARDYTFAPEVAAAVEADPAYFDSEELKREVDDCDAKPDVKQLLKTDLQSGAHMSVFKMYGQDIGCADIVGRQTVGDLLAIELVKQAVPAAKDIATFTGFMPEELALIVIHIDHRRRRMEGNKLAEWIAEIIAAVCYVAQQKDPRHQKSRKCPNPFALPGSQDQTQS
jgi:hypothetical protein